VTLAISKEAARRYLLGRSGLWPGRRWAGKEGAAAAIRALGEVQIDPLNVTARNHDLVLQARVLGYAPEQLDALLYRERRFFDYGSLLFIYPMEDLPYWSMHMRRRVEAGRWAGIATEHAAAIEEVRAALRERAPLGHRDFTGSARVESYRARKDTGLALWYLWITGELMTHGRRNFDRLYHFREAIAPPATVEPTEAEAEAFFARKAVRPLASGSAAALGATLSYYFHRRLDRAEARRWLDRLLDEGVAARVSVEGVRESYLAPADDLSLIEAVAGGTVPPAWQPLAATTEEEVSFIAPLDTIVHNRQRAMSVFDFEYLWEVYKPASQRRWGYYTLPILWGDRLVARFDPKLERKTGVLRVNGFWVEDAALLDDPAFAGALGRGLARFMRFLGAGDMALDGIDASGLRSRVASVLAASAS
jgi:uncharacterized protein